MPVRISRDNHGFYASWGLSGKRYYFSAVGGREAAAALAAKQGRAIHARARR